jgi:hypothetical protein
VRCLVDAVASFCVANCAVGAGIEGFGCAVTVHGSFLYLIEKDMDLDRVNRERKREERNCIVMLYCRMMRGGDVYDLRSRVGKARVNTSRHLALNLCIPISNAAHN